MAVPKKKTGKCAQGHRRSHWKAIVPKLVICTNCKEMTRPHTVCSECGYYDGKSIF
jgi:large subunit ribosomal protein L32